MSDLNSPITERNRRNNYVELYFHSPITSNKELEASLGLYENQAFFRLGSSKAIETGSAPANLMGELLLNSQEEGTKISTAIGVNSDLLQQLQIATNKNLSLGATYSYGDPMIGLRGQVNDDRYMTDHNLQVALTSTFGNSVFEYIVDIRLDNRYQLAYRYDF